MSIEITGVGQLKEDATYGMLSSREIPVHILGGHPCRFLLEGYEDDSAPEDFHEAIVRFVAARPEVLIAASSYVHAYYLDVLALTAPPELTGDPVLAVADIWTQVQFGREAIVSRRDSGDRSIYISLTCGCEWEPEHGLEIVFSDEPAVVKIGPFDGHLTNSDAYGDARLEGVIYKSLAA